MCSIRVTVLSPVTFTPTTCCVSCRLFEGACKTTPTNYCVKQPVFWCTIAFVTSHTITRGMHQQSQCMPHDANRILHENIQSMALRPEQRRYDPAHGTLAPSIQCLVRVMGLVSVQGRADGLGARSHEQQARIARVGVWAGATSGGGEGHCLVNTPHCNPSIVRDEERITGYV